VRGLSLVSRWVGILFLSCGGVREVVRETILSWKKRLGYGWMVEAFFIQEVVRGGGS
jgi:hypothetical protein